jgi:hypothetical protein
MPNGQYILQRRQTLHSVNAMRAMLRKVSGDTFPSCFISSQIVFFTLPTGANSGSLSLEMQV